MVATTGGISAEWDRLPRDGSQAWVGALLMVASGGVSVGGLGWLAAIIARVAMQ